MYLIDKDIWEYLPELSFVSDNPEYKFKPDEQIQPCSIDLRLSNVYWVPTKHSAIDLRRARLLELSPRRYWKKVVLKPGECVTIKPGGFILARIHEIFTIPVDCAGKIEGRSSFARMGLMIHCTGDFINPGWRGHMPLQLVNFNPNPIKLFPYIPICQLKLVKLSGIPQRLYGERELQSKYMDDDGGPSYWWRDKRIKRLQKTFGDVDVSIAIQRDVLDTIGIQEPEVLERFDNCVREKRVCDIENAETLLDEFAKDENQRKLRDSLAKNALTSLFPFFLAISVGSFLEQPIGFWHYLFWLITCVSGPISYFALRYELGSYLTSKELWHIRQSSKFKVLDQEDDDDDD